MNTVLDKHARVLKATFASRGKFGYALSEKEALALQDKLEEVDLFLESDKDVSFGKINYDKIPVAYMRSAVEAYIKYGDLPGAGLYGLLSGNYFTVSTYVDKENWKNLRKWAKWFRQEAPTKCYGSDIAVAFWCNRQRKILESFYIQVEDIYNLDRFNRQSRLKHKRALIDFH